MSSIQHNKNDEDFGHKRFGPTFDQCFNNIYNDSLSFSKVFGSEFHQCSKKLENLCCIGHHQYVAFDYN